jgi:hypothetical protein
MATNNDSPPTAAPSMGNAVGGPNIAHDVLILGGGHAGVRAARQLIRHQRRGERLDIALVSRDNVDLWHGLVRV